MAARRTDHSGGETNEELQSALEECFGVRVTRQQLESPTPALVTSVLHGVLRPLGLDEESLQTPLCLLTPEEAHIESAVPLLNNLALLQCVFKRVGIVDVGLSDLVDPKPLRTRRLLSALVNWFRKGKTHLEASATQAKLAACTARVNEIRASLASTADKPRAKTPELAEGSMTLEAYKTKIAAITADYQPLKTAFCTSTEALQRGKMELAEVEEALKEAQASVCMDPAAWKKKIAAQEEQLATCEQERDQLRSSVVALKEKVDQAPAIMEYLRATLDEVAELEELVAELEAAKQANAAAQEDRVKLERQYFAIEKKRKEASEEMERVEMEIEILRDMDAELEKRKQRNIEMRKRCEEMEAAYEKARLQ